MTLGRTSASLVALFVILLAPAANAQGLPGGGGGLPGGVTDTVEGTTGEVTDAVGGTTGEVTDTVDETTGGVTDTVGETTGGVTDTVEETTGGVTDTVEETTGGVTEPVEETTGGVTNTVDETTGGVIDTVEETTGGGGDSDSYSGGTSSLVDALFGSGSTPPSLAEIPPHLIPDIVEEGGQNGMTPAAAEGWIDGTKVMGNDFATPLHALASLAASFEDLFYDFAVTSSVPGSSAWNLAADSSGDSFFAVAGRAAAMAAKAIAFPLALALLVVGFLMAQGRIGRKDPKLVLAPLDTSSDTLTFE
jgi:hypothetical protein